jgi:hypothetical protein
MADLFDQRASNDPAPDTTGCARQKREQPADYPAKKKARAIKRGVEEVQGSLFDQTQTVAPATQPRDCLDPLIDDLVAEYLPQLEARLRAQLKQVLTGLKQE